MTDADKKQDTGCKKRALLGGTCGLIAGVLVAAALVFGLGVYAKRIDPDTLAAARPLPFPGSAQQLEEMTARLQKPQDVEPAAGGR